MGAGRHEGDGPPDGDGTDGEHVDQPNARRPDACEPDVCEPEMDQHGTRKRTRKHRRVTTEPVPGSDPNPQPEPLRHSGDENDDRLKADKPPHWG